MKWYERYQNPVRFLKDVINAPRETASCTYRTFKEFALLPFLIPVARDRLKMGLSRSDTNYHASQIFGGSLGAGLATALYVELALGVFPLEKVHDYIIDNPEFAVLPVITNLTALVAKHFQNKREKLAERAELERMIVQRRTEAEATRATMLKEAANRRRMYKFGSQENESRTKRVTLFSQLEP